MWVQYFIFVVALGAACFLIMRLAGTYRALRGKRLVHCPETNEFVAVELDGKYGAITGLVGKPIFRLQDCTRWPERRSCGQICLQEIEEAPEACLVRNILTKWYENRHCVCCGRKFQAINWFDHKPALLDTTERLIECGDIAPEKLPEALATYRPVCRNCATRPRALSACDAQTNNSSQNP
jgi:hypothetical protein